MPSSSLLVSSSLDFTETPPDPAPDEPPYFQPPPLESPPLIPFTEFLPLLLIAEPSSLLLAADPPLLPGTDSPLVSVSLRVSPQPPSASPRSQLAAPAAKFSPPSPEMIGSSSPHQPLSNLSSLAYSPHHPEPPDPPPLSYAFVPPPPLSTLTLALSPTRLSAAYLPSSTSSPFYLPPLLLFRRPLPRSPLPETAVEELLPCPWTSASALPPPQPLHLCLPPPLRIPPPLKPYPTHLSLVSLVWPRSAFKPSDLVLTGHVPWLVRKLVSFPPKPPDPPDPPDSRIPLPLLRFISSLPVKADCSYLRRPVPLQPSSLFVNLYTALHLPILPTIKPRHNSDLTMDIVFWLFPLSLPDIHNSPFYSAYQIFMDSCVICWASLPWCEGVLPTKLLVLEMLVPLDMYCLFFPKVPLSLSGLVDQDASVLQGFSSRCFVLPASVAGFFSAFVADIFSGFSSESNALTSVSDAADQDIHGILVFFDSSCFLLIKCIYFYLVYLAIWLAKLWVLFMFYLVIPPLLMELY